MNDDFDLMEDPDDSLSVTELRRRADAVLFANEFAVAYELPIEADPDRGYLTGWVTFDHTRDEDPVYEREAGMSGDDGMIRRMFSEMSPDRVERIERFIN